MLIVGLFIAARQVKQVLSLSVCMSVSGVFNEDSSFFQSVGWCQNKFGATLPLIEVVICLFVDHEVGSTCRVILKIVPPPQSEVSCQ